MPLVEKEGFHVCINSFTNLEAAHMPFSHILLAGTQSHSYT